MKKWLSLLLILLLSGCSLELDPDEIESRILKIAGGYPSTAAEGVSLIKTVSNGHTGYSATVQLTWGEKVGRFSTEKALAMYSREIAADVTRRTPSVAMLSLEWTVPFHSEDEAAMTYIYIRRKSGLTQSDLKDRFTDGTFGADAFIDPDAMVEVPVRRVVLPGESEAPSEETEDAPAKDSEEDAPDSTESPEEEDASPAPEENGD